MWGTKYGATYFYMTLLKQTRICLYYPLLTSLFWRPERKLSQINVHGRQIIFLKLLKINMQYLCIYLCLKCTQSPLDYAMLNMLPNKVKFMIRSAKVKLSMMKLWCKSILRFCTVMWEVKASRWYLGLVNWKSDELWQLMIKKPLRCFFQICFHRWRCLYCSRLSYKSGYFI